MNHTSAPDPISTHSEATEVPLLNILSLLAENWKWIVLTPIISGIAAMALSFLIQPMFTARTTFLPPQQQQSSSVSALQSLGALAGIASAGGVKSPADLYASLLQSTTVQDRLIRKFNLAQVYGEQYAFRTREKLQRNVQVTLGKKDGLITIEVSDEDPKRAAELAAAHVEELRSISGDLAVTEAQQRRVFFQQQLMKSKQRLIKAQETLQSSGLSRGTLKAEPKAAADSYARIKAAVAAADVNLKILRSYLTENAEEVQRQVSTLNALRSQLADAEKTDKTNASSDYISSYREFKYEEVLFEMLARQFETARVDESREGPLIQVIDAAQTPEWKSSPKRALIAFATALSTLVASFTFLIMRQHWRQILASPANASRIARIRVALKPRRAAT